MVAFEDINQIIPRKRFWQFWRRVAAVGIFEWNGTYDKPLGYGRGWPRFNPHFHMWMFMAWGMYGRGTDGRWPVPVAFYKFKPGPSSFKAFLILIITFGGKKYPNCKCAYNVRWRGEGHWCYSGGYSPQNPGSKMYEINGVISGPGFKVEIPDRVVARWQ